MKPLSVQLARGDKIGRQFDEHGAVMGYNKEHLRGDITTWETSAT